MSGGPGIYVEILIRKDVEEIWRLTQEPHLHQRWDLRFTEIAYLPRPSASEPQHFLYQTRIGFGLSIKGTGESSGTRALEGGERTSSLRFASEDPKSLIREGSGYWRYVPTPEGLRFLTWYDYQVRFGRMGQLTDRVLFRPLIGWATAWSFDRLRLWAEEGLAPESLMALSLVHAIARTTIAAIWAWHGLVPKLVFRQMDERMMLQQAGLPVSALPWIGAAEIAIAFAILTTWRQRSALLVNCALMVVATAVVTLRSPQYVTAAFNPVTLNLAVIGLSVVGWIAARQLPSSRRCFRAMPKEQR